MSVVVYVNIPFPYLLLYYDFSPSSFVLVSRCCTIMWIQIWCDSVTSGLTILPTLTPFPTILIYGRREQIEKDGICWWYQRRYWWNHPLWKFLDFRCVRISFLHLSMVTFLVLVLVLTQSFIYSRIGDIIEVQLPPPALTHHQQTHPTGNGALLFVFIPQHKPKW